MDRNTIFGFVLIGIVLMVWMWLNAPPPQQQEKTVNAPVPAPTPSDVAIHITASQDGQSVEVPVGQRFAVELVGVPTAGYVWQPAQIPPFLTRAGEALHAQHSYAEALARFQQALDHSPIVANPARWAHLQHWLGNCHLSYGWRVEEEAEHRMQIRASKFSEISWQNTNVHWLLGVQRSFGPGNV